MWKLKTYMHNANNIQDMVWTDRKKTNQDTHILTCNNQYGYKEGISTIDAIIKVAQYVEQADGNAELLLNDISEDFDTINRTPLWTTLYKKGLPEETTIHISRGHQGARLAPKYKGRYGNPNGGKYRGLSSISSKCDPVHNLNGRRDG